jgi:hypothetical protein
MPRSKLSKAAPAMLETLKRVRKWVDDYMDFGERECPFCGHHHYHSVVTRCPYLDIEQAIELAGGDDETL